MGWHALFLFFGPVLSLFCDAEMISRSIWWFLFFFLLCFQSIIDYDLVPVLAGNRTRADKMEKRKTEVGTCF